MSKLIKKCQSGDIVVKSDNTRVASPIIKEKPIYIQPQSKQTYVSADYRSPWQQQQDQKKAEIAYNMYIDEKNKELALQHALGLATVADVLMFVPDATDLITKGIRYVGKKQLQKKAAKALTEVLDNGTPVVNGIANARTINYTPTTAKANGNTSLAFYERPSTLTQAELQGLSKVERTNFGRRPTNWGNLRFFRNLEGLPSIQDGKIIISPQSNMVANVTTDLPFRLHDHYSMLPGREYMMIHPEGLKNFSPINLDPMDTMFPNQGLSVSPEYVTIISGNPEILREAKKLGMSVQTSPKLQSLYFTADDLTYSKAVDDLITELGRPGIKEYKTLSGITGLDIKVEPYTNQLDVYNKLKHRVRNMSMDELDRTFAPTYQSGVIYPDGTNLGIYDLAFPSVLNDEVIPYQKVFYNPAPMVEQNTMLDLGLHAHPQFIPTNPRSVRLYEDLLKLRGKPLRKQGGRLIPKHSKGNPVNTNPLPKRPINTNPVPEVKPKKRKLIQIKPNFKNEIPTPGMITFPVVGFKQS